MEGLTTTAITMPRVVFLLPAKLASGFGVGGQVFGPHYGALTFLLASILGWESCRPTTIRPRFPKYLDCVMTIRNFILVTLKHKKSRPTILSVYKTIDAELMHEKYKSEQNVSQ